MHGPAVNASAYAEGGIVHNAALLRCHKGGGAENAGVENAGEENTGAITYGKLPNRK